MIIHEQNTRNLSGRGLLNVHKMLPYKKKSIIYKTVTNKNSKYLKIKLKKTVKIRLFIAS